jgi:hypothetical protein
MLRVMKSSNDCIGCMGYKYFRTAIAAEVEAVRNNQLPCWKTVHVRWHQTPPSTVIRHVDLESGELCENSALSAAGVPSSP